MTSTLKPLTQRGAWKALTVHHKIACRLHLRKLFSDDPNRGERMTAEAEGLFLDYSKNRITDDTLKLLVRLAEESGLRDRIEAMFRGDKINVTENRAVLHVALRAPRGCSLLSWTAAMRCPTSMPCSIGCRTSPSSVRSGTWKGHTGNESGTFVNI